jgi:hypothetical protein
MSMDESHQLAIAAAKRGDYEQGAAIAQAAGLYDTAATIRGLAPVAPDVAESDIYTPEQLKRLTRAEARANWDKVEKSMAANAAQRGR